MKETRREQTDPMLSRYDHGIAELRVDGEVRAHLACVVLTLHNGDPWPWYVVVWPNGRKELSEEDYGPDWCAVNEWDAGFFTYWSAPSIVKKVRFLGRCLVHDSDEITYDMRWLSPEDAARTWKQLGLEDTDF